MGGRVTTARSGITAAQRAALGRLASSLPESAYLAGGVAAAIRCGHRISVEDLVTMKLAAIVDRGAARDFWDLHELMRTQALSLEAVLALHQRRFPRHDVGHVVRALVYFADAEAAPLPAALTGEHWEAIKADFRASVRAYAAR